MFSRNVSLSLTKKTSKIKYVTTEINNKPKVISLGKGPLVNEAIPTTETSPAAPIKREVNAFAGPNLNKKYKKIPATAIATAIETY